METLALGPIMLLLIVVEELRSIVELSNRIVSSMSALLTWQVAPMLVNGPI